MTFVFLPHTGDLRVKVEGKTPEDVYVASMLALAEVLKPIRPHRPSLEKRRTWIEIHSVDRTTLLIDFLSEVLTESYSQKAIFIEIEDAIIGEKDFKGWISGVSIDEFDDEIKAITYHEAELIKNDSGNWETNIVFDI